jgi:hypothetical protein
MTRAPNAKARARSTTSMQNTQPPMFWAASGLCARFVRELAACGCRFRIVDFRVMPGAARGGLLRP